MKEIRCPLCDMLLMKASLIDAEVKCKKCKNLVRIRRYTQSQLLTANDKVNTISLRK